MTNPFESRRDILPAAQNEIWLHLAPAKDLGFVLYDGTAVTLYCGHRVSIDFDFFSSSPLDKALIDASFAFAAQAEPIQEDRNTIVLAIPMPSGNVKLSFFGGLKIGRVDVARETSDGVLSVASPDDLLATKLKAILDRAEAKDYLDIAALLSSGVPLECGLGAFAAMYGRDPVLALRGIGYFDDGDLRTVPVDIQEQLRAARDAVKDVPEIEIISGTLGGGRPKPCRAWPRRR